MDKYKIDQLDTLRTIPVVHCYTHTHTHTHTHTKNDKEKVKILMVKRQ